MKELWTEKYRPNTLTDYVFRDQAQREQVEGWVKSGAITCCSLARQVWARPPWPES